MTLQESLRILNRGQIRLWTIMDSDSYAAAYVAIQEACARIGAVNGRGLAAIIKANYSKKVLYAAVLLVVVANYN